MQSPFEHIEKLYLSVINNKCAVQSCFINKVFPSLSIDVQNKILETTLRNPISLVYPPPKSFQKLFLRTLIDRVEELGCECSDDLAQTYACMFLEPDEEEKIYKSYKLNEDIIVTLQEDPCFVTRSTTGLQTWEAAKYLSEWCIENEISFQNKTVLELGSGIGLLGIVISKCCSPAKYIFSDKSWEVLRALSENIKINNKILKNVEIGQHQLVWDNINIEDAVNLCPDVILGADIVFDPDTLEGLVSALKIFLLNGCTCAYIASTIRNPETNYKFEKLLEESGLVYSVMEGHSQSIYIYNQMSFKILKIGK